MNHKKLFFFHNPKAAGTSMMQTIEKETEAVRTCPPIENTICSHAAHQGRYDSFRGYDLYMGHYGRDVFDTVRDGHAYISNFRHPVSRVISHYNYLRLSVSLKENMTPEDEIDYTCMKAAKSMKFSDFVAYDHPDVRVYISNFHFRQLTASPWVFEQPKATLEQACSFIDGMLCYYVCEYPELSMRMFRRRLGLAPIPTVNVTEKEGAILLSDLDDDVFAAIMQMNRLDMAIYEYAVKALLRAA